MKEFKSKGIFIGKRTFRQKVCALMTLGLFLTQPLSAMAMAVPDQKAPTDQKPKITFSQKGVEVVNIATPSKAGVSHNLYSMFNVSSQGVILNNSSSSVQTSLGGKVKGNKNLTNGSATVILNEVTGRLPSILKGQIEIAGQKADLIIANPNGIVGNGFGFINANRAVLTTGKAMIGSHGSLDGFQVSKGTVSIGKNGVDALNTASFDILSQSASITGPIFADQLNIVTGTNQVAYSTLGTQPISGKASNSQNAIDIGDLGGMYANKIYLVSTDQGVGVNSQGIIRSQSNLNISSNGTISLSGSTWAGENATIQAKDDVVNQNRIYTKGNLTVATEGNLQNGDAGLVFSEKNMNLAAKNVSSTGTIATGIHEDGTFGTEGDLQITSQGTVNLAGNVTTAGNTNVTAKDAVTNNSYIYANGNVNINTQGDLQNTSTGIIAAAQNTNVTAKNVKSDGTVLAGLKKDWTLGTAGDVTVTSSGKVDVSGNITAGRNVQITAQGDLNNVGQIYAQNDTKIQVSGNAQNTSASADKIALIAAGNNVEVSGQNITSTGAITAGEYQDGTVSVSGDVTISGTGSVALSGNTGAESGKVTVTGSDVNLSNGKVVSGEGISIQATQGDVNNTSGMLVSGKDLKINATQGSILNDNGQIINDKNAGTVLLFAGKNVKSNNGEIVSNGKMFIRGNYVFNNNGKILGKDAVAFFLTGLQNSGMIASKSTLLINGNGLISNSGQLMSNDILRITGSPAISNSGQIVSDKTVDVWASNPVSITGLGAPMVLVNGQNQALKYYLMPVWNGFGVRFIMQVAEVIPVWGAAFTVFDSLMYGIIGDTDTAREKLYEIPLAFVGASLEAKSVKLASTTFKAEEKTIATTEKMIASGENKITNSEKVIGNSEKALANSERVIADSERTIATAKDAIATDGKSLVKLERELAVEKRAIITGKETVEAGQKAIAKIENEIADIEKSIAAENKTITTAREAIANEKETIATEEKTIANEKKAIVNGEKKLNFDLQLFASNEGAGKAELGRKLDYIFGKATGSKHNIDRSVAMERQLNSVGIFDNAEGRQLVENNLIEAFNNPASILKAQENGRVVRESLLSGPNGVIKVESVWDGSKLITVTLFGGR